MNKLARLIDDPRIVVAPGAHDPPTAWVVQELGYHAVYVPGNGISGARYGHPDMGLVSYTEFLGAVEAITKALDIPAIVDADTGFGGVANVRRLVRELESLGVAAIHLEDQAFPKRCGYLEGGSLVPASEMCERLQVALDTRHDMMIIARSEAGVCGFEEAVERCRMYSEVGADMIFVNGMTELEHAQRTVDEIPGPHLFNFSASDQAPKLTVEQAEKLGYSALIYPIHALRLQLSAVREMLLEVRASGDMAPWLTRMVSFQEWQQLTGVPEIYALEDRYAGKR